MVGALRGWSVVGAWLVPWLVQVGRVPPEQPVRAPSRPGPPTVTPGASRTVEFAVAIAAAVAVANVLLFGWFAAAAAATAAASLLLLQFCCYCCRSVAVAAALRLQMVLRKVEWDSEHRRNVEWECRMGSRQMSNGTFQAIPKYIRPCHHMHSVRSGGEFA